MRYRRGWVRRGTGITPMYQVALARAVCGDPADETLRERMPQPGQGCKVMVWPAGHVPGAASTMDDDVFVF
ncbi:hypothetical protein MYCTH_2129511 [Thermothelomyces thermophilus ATCC 42464]|uniref:Uncharacterized protein n=1 Tax=Thermothelomyces thermophilus (strain ATCC 42464 / BCRC 31852 / DSM 1799) TaxID=573729 RepID=G2QIZ2_THET4|nr:uncharacterized protein MYCTH_2129511 [Thermothelomyces thermophilus ATCC 42464]AEO60411.1 hypothetical protein MYCTH_2129511 [Thermothelomyces thermophilus ATCC 42464]